MNNTAASACYIDAELEGLTSNETTVASCYGEEIAYIVVGDVKAWQRERERIEAIAGGEAVRPIFGLLYE